MVGALGLAAHEVGERFIGYDSAEGDATEYASYEWDVQAARSPWPDIGNCDREGRDR
jgi:hypothetical protein